MSELARPQPVSTWQAWLLAARPKTLPAAVAPIAVGTALAIADGGFHLGAALVALLISLLLQVAANFANDVSDFKRGADDEERVGPLRVTQHGLLTPSAVITGTAIVVGLAVVLGSYLVWRGGWPVLLLGVLAILAMLSYTGGPLPTGYIGLGEVSVFIFFGLVGVTGSYYVQTLEITTLSVLAAIPVGALIAAILVVNNLRDMATDARAGKRTLAVRLGRNATLIEFGLLIAIAYLTPVVLWIAGLHSAWWLLEFLTLPLTVKLVISVRQESGPALNRRLAETARLALVYSLVLAGSVLL